MKVNVRYATEFGSSATTINVEEIPTFTKRFTILSVTPHEETYTEQEVKTWLEHRDMYLHNYYTTYKNKGIAKETIDEFINESHEYLMGRKQNK